MTAKTITIAPVRKSIVVKAPQARAFEVFTTGIDRWWPKAHNLGTSPIVECFIEPRVGGRWYSKHEDGSEVATGHVLAWEPPSRVVISWEVNTSWKADSTITSEIETRFIAEGPHSTRVELEHRNFESLGQEGGQKMRDQVDGGWPSLMELFRAAAEA